MPIQLEHADHETVVHLFGDLDLAAEPEVEATLGDLCDAGRNVIIDTSGVTFIDSSGIRALLVARQRCLDGGGAFALRQPSAQVSRLLELVGLIGTINIIE